MTHPSIARCLLGILCLGQWLGTFAIDLGRTHARNPSWTGHARFHVVWQSSTLAFSSILALLLLLLPGPLQAQRFYLASILTALPMLGFFAALIGRRRFGATLTDENGMPPLRLSIHGTTRRIDLNLVAELVGVFAWAVIVWLYGWGAPQ